MTLDKCPRCDRAGKNYCAELGRPCVPMADRPKPREPRHYTRRKLGVPVSKDRKAYYREYDQRIRRESGWFKDSTSNYTSVAPLAATFAPNEITA